MSTNITGTGKTQTFLLFAADVSGMANKFNNDNIRDKVQYYLYCRSAHMYYIL